MNTVKVKLVGKAPLLMHNSRLVNPLDEYVKAIKAITSKPARDKTDKDQEDIWKLEFLGGLHWCEEVGPYVPDYAMLATIMNGAKFQRKGAEVERSVTIIESKIPLDYKGPKDLEGLWDKGFFDIRPVGAQGNRGGSKTMRCRPSFNEWAVTFTLMFDHERINVSAVKQALTDAGNYVGLLDGRPFKGKYDVVTFSPSNGS